MATTIVGIKRFTSKDGKDYEVINIMEPYKPHQLARGCVGSKVEAIFLPDEMMGIVKDEDVGKNAVLTYDSENGRSYLIGIEVKK